MLFNKRKKEGKRNNRKKMAKLKSDRRQQVEKGIIKCNQERIEGACGA
jgi:hypothetical protein